MVASAHPGDLDSYDCHTCYTNCTTWGLSYGQYHCHNPKPPQYPCFIPKANCSQTLLDSYYQYKQQSLTLCSRYGIAETNCTDTQNWEQKITQCTQDIQDYNTATQTYNDCEAKNDQLFKEWALLIIEQKIAPNEKTLNINCPTNSVIKNGTCDCGLSYYNKEKNQCQSLQEYCVSTLGEGGHFKSFSGKLPDIIIQCECNEGYTKNNSGYCAKTEINKCPANSSESNGKCFCNNGYTTNEDKNGCVLVPKLETPKIEETPTEKQQPTKTPALQQSNINTTIKNKEIQKTIEDQLSITSTTATEGTATTQEKTKNSINSTDNTIKESFFIKITQNVKNVFINIFKKLKFW